MNELLLNEKINIIAKKVLDTKTVVHFTTTCNRCGTKTLNLCEDLKTINQYNRKCTREYCDGSQIINENYYTEDVPDWGKYIKEVEE